LVVVARVVQLLLVQMVETLSLIQLPLSVEEVEERKVLAVRMEVVEEELVMTELAQGGQVHREVTAETLPRGWLLHTRLRVEVELPQMVQT
jgi:hypothetical protein